MCVTVLMVATAIGVQADGNYHVVRPGETLYAIGRLYGVNPNDIAAANHLANPNLIYPGQVLAVPAMGWHGDRGVAQHHGTDRWGGDFAPAYSPVASTGHSWQAYAQPEWALLEPADMCPSWLTCFAGEGCGLTNATAICRDGTCSCSQVAAGACWGHGGVRCYVAAPADRFAPRDEDRQRTWRPPEIAPQHDWGDRSDARPAAQRDHGAPAQPVAQVRAHNVFAEAWAGDPTPPQYTMVTIYGRLTADGVGIASAPMQVTWDAGSVIGNCSGVTRRGGEASCATYVAGAAPGYSVPVQVSFTYQGQVYYAQTSFVPWW